MATRRAWHPLRLALIFATLALASGATAARTAYAELSTPAASALAVAHAPRVADRAAATTTFRAPSLTAPLAAADSRPVAALYLTHCALLL